MHRPCTSTPLLGPPPKHPTLMPSPPPTHPYTHHLYHPLVLHFPASFPFQALPLLRASYADKAPLPPLCPPTALVTRMRMVEAVQAVDLGPASGPVDGDCAGGKEATHRSPLHLPAWSLAPPIRTQTPTSTVANPALPPIAAIGLQDLRKANASDASPPCTPRRPTPPNFPTPARATLVLPRAPPPPLPYLNIRSQPRTVHPWTRAWFAWRNSRPKATRL